MVRLLYCLNPFHSVLYLYLYLYSHQMCALQRHMEPTSPIHTIVHHIYTVCMVLVNGLHVLMVFIGLQQRKCVTFKAMLVVLPYQVNE